MTIHPHHTSGCLSSEERIESQNEGDVLKLKEASKVITLLVKPRSELELKQI